MSMAGHWDICFFHTFLFSHWNRKSKNDSVIISSLAFTPETNMLSDSLCPTILILPHPTLPVEELK